MSGTVGPVALILLDKRVLGPASRNQVRVAGGVPVVAAVMLCIRARLPRHAGTG
jgi:hypothetical protein